MKYLRIETYGDPSLHGVPVNHPLYGAIQVLRNAVGGGRVSDFPDKSITKMYGSTLLALQGWVSTFQKKPLRST